MSITKQTDETSSERCHSCNGPLTAEFWQFISRLLKTHVLPLNVVRCRAEIGIWFYFGIGFGYVLRDSISNLKMILDIQYQSKKYLCYYWYFRLIFIACENRYLQCFLRSSHFDNVIISFIHFKKVIMFTECRRFDICRCSKNLNWLLIKTNKTHEHFFEKIHQICSNSNSFPISTWFINSCVNFPR